MKKKAIKSMAALLAFSCFGTVALSAKIPYEVTYKYSESKLTLNGSAENVGEVLAFQILKEGISFDEPYGITDVLHANQFLTDEDKKFLFNVEFEAVSGDYEAAVSSDKSKEKTMFLLHLVSKEDFEAAYNTLNTFAAEDNFEGFKAYINENADDLNLVFSLTDGKTLNDELKNYYTYIKSNPLSVSNEEENTRIYKTYITSFELNDENIENLDTVIDELYFKDENVFKLYKEVAQSEEIQEYFTDKISDKDITDMDLFSDAAKEALILTTVRYADGAQDIKNVLEEYGSVIGIGGNASDSVYRKLAGNDYDSGAELKEAYEEKKESQSSSSGGSLGGSSGGRGSLGSSVQGNISYNPITSQQQIKMVFNDIDGVMWASEAILALADKGIISGKADKIFAPDDNITREEFTKILVGAMGISEEEYGENVFSDVKDDAWYCKYVNIASKRGIVNGIGGGNFGIGENVTRQDMVVMLYRALKSRNVELNVTEVTFDDKDSVSDYAKDAVSALYNLGAVNGVGENRFEPKGFATRAQAAKVIYGILNLLK